MNRRKPIHICFVDLHKIDGADGTSYVFELTHSGPLLCDTEGNILDEQPEEGDPFWLAFATWFNERGA